MPHIKSKRIDVVKIMLCSVMLITSLWYWSYINNEGYSFAGYANYTGLMFTGHITMLALVPDALRDAIKYLGYCSWTDFSDLPQALIDLFMAYLNMSVWATGTFGLFTLHSKKGLLWISLFYIATVVVNVLNIIVYGVGSI